MSSPFDTFHLFPRLPIELREEIWTLSLPGRRFLAPQMHQYLPLVARRRPSGVEVKSDPIALQVNRESRAVALRHYHKLECSNSGPYQYVDFNVDTINLTSGMLYFVLEYLTCDNASTRDGNLNDECYLQYLGFSAAELSKIVSLEIEFDGWSVVALNRDGLGDILRDWLESFTGLKELRVITYEKNWTDQPWRRGALKDDDVLFLYILDAARHSFIYHARKVLEENGVEWQQPTVALIRKKWAIEEPGYGKHYEYGPNLIQDLIDESSYPFSHYEIKMDPNVQGK